MKKRVSIYIDVDAWENLKEHAWHNRKSASAYLEDLITGEIPFKSEYELREKVNTVKEILKEKPKKLIKSKEDVAKFTGGYSKEKQLSKGAKNRRKQE
jgi:hypothetical protein